jgi:tRNA-2-methylthio-N6-dimethylallyladenosine synthase
VRNIREARPGISITTDIIVGFPGETESDFEQTCELVQEIQFDNAFVFRYSPRRDTPAAAMADQVDERVKEQRNQDLLGIINESARQINERLIGRTLEVLCEGPSKTNPRRLTGRTRTNKLVHFEAGQDVIGELMDIRIERATPFSLQGTPIGRKS